MADANVATLQRALNRFASPIGFSPIATDGVVGPVTLTTAKRVLGYIQVALTDADEPFSSQAMLLESKTCGSTTALAVGAAQLAGFLNQVATAWGYTPGDLVVEPGGGTVVGAGSQLTSSLLAVWQRLPTWKKLSMIVIILVTAAWGRKAWKSRKGAA